MTVENTIKNMMTQYPELFITRADCLSHLFLIYGNGYHWIKGQLVPSEIDEADVDDYDDNIHIADEHYVMSEDEFTKRMNARADFYRTYCDRIRARKNVDKLLLKKAEDVLEKYSRTRIINRWSNDWSPMFSRIVNFPSDIKEDWRKAIKECVALMKSDNVPYVDEVIAELKNKGLNP